MWKERPCHEMLRGHSCYEMKRTDLEAGTCVISLQVIEGDALHIAQPGTELRVLRKVLILPNWRDLWWQSRSWSEQSHCKPFGKPKIPPSTRELPRARPSSYLEIGRRQRVVRRRACRWLCAIVLQTYRFATAIDPETARFAVRRLENGIHDCRKKRLRRTLLQEFLCLLHEALLLCNCRRILRFVLVLWCRPFVGPVSTDFLEVLLASLECGAN